MRRTLSTAALAMATTFAAVSVFAQAPGAPAPAVSAPAAAQPAADPTAAGTTPISAAATPVAAARPAAPPVVPGAITPPGDYLIGVDDQLEVLYWQDKDMSATVSVRPDGYVSLPLVNDIKAAGLTPEQFRLAVTEAASKLMAEPTVGVGVKAINSRKVYVTGQIGKPGPQPLMETSTTVLQMLATVGGPNEYAKTDKITIIRRENGKDQVYKFNYKDVSVGKRLEQNIVLKPGDTIIVP